MIGLLAECLTGFCSVSFCPHIFTLFWGATADCIRQAGLDTSLTSTSLIQPSLSPFGWPRLGSAVAPFFKTFLLVFIFILVNYCKSVNLIYYNNYSNNDKFTGNYFSQVWCLFWWYLILKIHISQQNTAKLNP